MREVKSRNKKNKSIRFILLLGLLALIPCMWFQQKVEAKSESTWNTKKSIQYQDGDYTFYAFASTDQKTAWIHTIKIKKGGTKQPLTIPGKMKGMKVTKLAPDINKYKTGMACYLTVFGTIVEPWHELDGSTSETKKIKQLSIPNSVEFIGSGTFCGMDGIQKVTLPSSIIEIENDAFYGCDALKAVNYPNKCNKLFTQAFNGCARVKFVFGKNNLYFKEKDGIIYSKDYSKVYWVDPNKEKVSFVAKVKSLEAGALIESKATELIIPKYMESIALGAIQCKNLKSVKVDKQNPYFALDGTTLYEKKTKRLVLAIMQGNSCKISDMVEVITKDAALCYSMGNEYVDECDIFLSTSLKKISEGWGSAWASTPYLVNLYYTAPNPPELMDGDDKNYMVYSFHSYIPKDAEESYLPWMRKYQNMESVVTYFEGEIKQNSKYEYYLGEKQVKILKYLGKEKEVSIPKKIAGRAVTEIAEFAFDCGKMQKITVPDTVTIIEKEAFARCENLKSIQLPSNLQLLGYGVFSECTSLKRINLPQNLHMLPIAAFQNCSSLEAVTLPEGITIIPLGCFEGCKKLQNMSIPSTIKEIHSSAFCMCESMTKIVIPDSVEKIEGWAFANCKGLITAVLPKHLEDLAPGLFNECTSLKKVEMGDTFVGIGMNCFGNCTSLISLGGDITITQSVDDSAFLNCSKLKGKITLGSKCASIWGRAFYNCKNLTFDIKSTKCRYWKDSFYGCKLSKQLKNKIAKGTK